MRGRIDCTLHMPDGADKEMVETFMAQAMQHVYKCLKEVGYDVMLYPTLFFCDEGVGKIARVEFAKDDQKV